MRNFFTNTRGYNGPFYIFNKLYPFSVEETRKGAEKAKYRDLLEDINRYGKEDTFLYKFLQKNEKSSIAEEYLNRMWELRDKSFEFLEKYNSKTETIKIGNKKLGVVECRPHLQTYDIGWFQLLKGVLEKEKSLKELLEEFDKIYDKFTEDSKEGVKVFRFL